MTTTFDFGDGPVPAHRHVNPDGTEGGWVADTARVEPTAYVGVDARVWGNAEVYENARVCGEASVCGNAVVFEEAWVCGDSVIDAGKWAEGVIDTSPEADGPKM